MRKFKTLVILFFGIIYLSSCTNPKQKYIEDFGSFINEVELDQKNYTEDEWKYIEVDFNDFSEIEYMYYKNNLTEIEKNQISSYRERYKKMRVKHDPSGSILEILGF